MNELPYRPPRGQRGLAVQFTVSALDAPGDQGSLFFTSGPFVEVGAEDVVRVTDSAKLKNDVVHILVFIIRVRSSLSHSHTHPIALQAQSNFVRCKLNVTAQDVWT
jgi:hypothetical protein